MKHLLVTNDFPPKIGGIQSLLWEWWRRLPPDRFAVLTSPYAGAAQFDSAQAYRIERTPEPVLLPHPWMVRRIDRLARAFGADLIVLDPAVPLGLVGPYLELPYDVVLHGAEVTVPGRLPGSKQALGNVLRQARHVISAGDYAAREAERAAGRSLPVTVVPPGVDVERFRPLDDDERAAARTSFGLPTDVELVVSISRLVPRKGFDVAIEAAARLAPSRPDLLLAISGGGRDERRLRDLAAARKAPVRFLGRVANDRLPSLYACADVFTMACRTRWGGLEQEGFGIVFVEAAACGVPQVAGDSGGAAEAVDDGVTGVVVRHPEDPDEVAAALEALLDDPARDAPTWGGRHASGPWPSSPTTCWPSASAGHWGRADVGSTGEPGSMGDVQDDGTQSAVADSAAADGDTAVVEAAQGTDDAAALDGHEPTRPAAVPDRLAGDIVIRGNLAGTLLFGVTAGLAAVLFTTVWQWIAAVTALALFAVGVFAFLWSYYNAVQRSRTDEISVSGLYFLAGPPTPARVRRIMLLTLLLQLVIALVTTLARTQSSDGRPGTSLALGFLVPMLGFGLNGLWAAYHADFPSRQLFEDRSGS